MQHKLERLYAAWGLTFFVCGAVFIAMYVLYQLGQLNTVENIAAIVSASFIGLSCVVGLVGMLVYFARVLIRGY